MTRCQTMSSSLRPVVDAGNGLSSFPIHRSCITFSCRIPMLVCKAHAQYTSVREYTIDANFIPCLAHILQAAPPPGLQPRGKGPYAGSNDRSREGSRVGSAAPPGVASEKKNSSSRGHSGNSGSDSNTATIASGGRRTKTHGHGKQQQQQFATGVSHSHTNNSSTPSASTKRNSHNHSNNHNATMSVGNVGGRHKLGPSLLGAAPPLLDLPPGFSRSGGSGGNAKIINSSPPPGLRPVQSFGRGISLSTSPRGAGRNDRGDNYKRPRGGGQRKGGTFDDVIRMLPQVPVLVLNNHGFQGSEPALQGRKGGDRDQPQAAQKDVKNHAQHNDTEREQIEQSKDRDDRGRVDKSTQNFGAGAEVLATDKESISPPSTESNAVTTAMAVGHTAVDPAEKKQKDKAQRKREKKLRQEKERERKRKEQEQEKERRRLEREAREKEQREKLQAEKKRREAELQKLKQKQRELEKEKERLREIKREKEEKELAAKKALQEMEERARKAKVAEEKRAKEKAEEAQRNAENAARETQKAEIAKKEERERTAAAAAAKANRRDNNRDDKSSGNEKAARDQLKKNNKSVSTDQQGMLDLKFIYCLRVSTPCYSR